MGSMKHTILLLKYMLQKGPHRTEECSWETYTFGIAKLKAPVFVIGFSIVDMQAFFIPILFKAIGIGLQF